MSSNIKKNGVRLLSFSDNKISYGGFCKVTLNCLSKQILVEPYDENIKMISASFEWNMYFEENILIIESYLVNIVLVFKSSKLAKKVYKAVKKREKNEIKDVQEVFIKYVFTPLMSKANDPNILKIIKGFISKCTDKKKYLEMIKTWKKDNHTNERLRCENSSNSDNHGTQKSDDRNANEDLKSNPLKRKRCVAKSTTKSNSTAATPTVSDNPQKSFIHKYDYKIIDSAVKNVKKQILIVFEPTNKELCYEYCLNGAKFYCAGCLSMKKITSAKLHNFGAENENVELFQTDHICTLRPYNPERFTEEWKSVAMEAETTQRHEVNEIDEVSLQDLIYEASAAKDNVNDDEEEEELVDLDDFDKTEKLKKQDDIKMEKKVKKDETEDNQVPLIFNKMDDSYKKIQFSGAAAIYNLIKIDIPGMIPHQKLFGTKKPGWAEETCYEDLPHAFATTMLLLNCNQTGSRQGITHELLKKKIHLNDPFGNAAITINTGERFIQVEPSFYARTIGLVNNFNDRRIASPDQMVKIAGLVLSANDESFNKALALTTIFYEYFAARICHRWPMSTFPKAVKKGGVLQKIKYTEEEDIEWRGISNLLGFINYLISSLLLNKIPDAGFIRYVFEEVGYGEYVAAPSKDIPMLPREMIVPMNDKAGLGPEYYEKFKEQGMLGYFSSLLFFNSNYYRKNAEAVQNDLKKAWDNQQNSKNKKKEGKADKRKKLADPNFPILPSEPKDLSDNFIEHWKAYHFNKYTAPELEKVLLAANIVKAVTLGKAFRLDLIPGAEKLIEESEGSFYESMQIFVKMLEKCLIGKNALKAEFLRNPLSALFTSFKFKTSNDGYEPTEKDVEIEKKFARIKTFDEFMTQQSYRNPAKTLDDNEAQTAAFTCSFGGFLPKNDDLEQYIDQSCFVPPRLKSADIAPFWDKQKDFKNGLFIDDVPPELLPAESDIRILQQQLLEKDIVIKNLQEALKKNNDDGAAHHS